MEDNLNILLNGRQPQFLIKWKMTIYLCHSSLSCVVCRHFIPSHYKVNDLQHKAAGFAKGTTFSTHGTHVGGTHKYLS